MHYENISPDICKANGWTEVTLPLTLEVVGHFHTYKSRGRYNYGPEVYEHGNRVLFELEEDATYFKLKYA